MINLDSTKHHLRLPSDYEAEDDVINSLINAATEYVTDLTGIENDSEAPATYDLVCQLLIAHWFGNRESANEKQYHRIPHGVDALLTTLRSAGGLI